jgi:hypothetical protein
MHEGNAGKRAEGTAAVMPTHARKGWTIPQVALGAACGILGAGIAVLGFIDIYLTVTHLLYPMWGAWSWTVILLGEGSFTGAYLGALLLDLRDKPPGRVRVFLAAYLSAFAAGSLLLNLYAGRGSVPGLASHAIVVGAFFGYLFLVKIIVKRLSADVSARALEVALADARQYAIDLLRARLGLLWRFRCPSLLRRQVTTGRLCDAVREDVRSKIAVGRTSGWESAVREWVLGADGLNLAVQAEVASRKAAENITRVASPLPLSPALEGTVAPPVVTPAKVSPKTATTSAVKRVNKLGRRATDDDLLDAMREMAAEGRTPSKTRVKAELPVGDVRAGQLVALFEAQQPVPISRASAAR